MVDARMLAELGVTEAYYTYPKSFKSLKTILPYLFQDLKFIENELVMKNIVAHIARSIKLGEDNFNKAFGGWRPASDEFGMTPLNPRHVNYTNAPAAGVTNEWIWQSGAVASIVGAGVFENWITLQPLPDNRLIMVFGYFNLEAVPNTMQLQAQLGDKTLPVIDLQSLQMKAENYAIMPDIWIIIPRSTMMVNVSCRVINTWERMGLLGFAFGDDADLITQ